MLGFILPFLPLNLENLKILLGKHFLNGDLERNLKFLQNGFEFARSELE